MSEYKLVPVDTVRRAASILGSQGFDAWDQLASELDGIVTAPAVQGEPVLDAKFGGILCLQVDGKPDQWRRINPCKLYATPNPAEQKPDDSAAVRLDKQCREDVAAALGFVRGGNYAWSYLLQQIKDITSAEGRHPAPDVTKLSREALAELIKGMAVSVDVSTGESDFGNRYFGVVDEVQWNANERHGMMLLVQEPEANFATPVSPDVAEDEL